MDIQLHSQLHVILSYIGRIQVTTQYFVSNDKIIIKIWIFIDLQELLKDNLPVSTLR